MASKNMMIAKKSEYRQGESSAARHSFLKSMRCKSSESKLAGR